MLSLSKANSRLLSPFLRCKTAAKYVQATFRVSSQDKKIYELRKYELKPEYFFNYMGIIQSGILESGFKETNLKCLGFWSVDYGGVYEMIHMYEFESFDARNTIYASMFTSPIMQSYVGEVGHMPMKLHNAILNAFPWYNVVEKPTLQKGVYELITSSVKPGKLNEFSRIAESSIDHHTKYSQLLGIWYNEFGKLNQVYRLWHYASAEERVKVRKEAEKDEKWLTTVQKLQELVSEDESVLMTPVNFSPWQ